MSDASGWLWLFIDVALVILLAAALIYGMVMWRRWRQNPSAAVERDERTRDLFRHNAK
jgi:hypothetical protein